MSIALFIMTTSFGIYDQTSPVAIEERSLGSQQSDRALSGARLAHFEGLLHE
jgi:hypothetical protein